MKKILIALVIAASFIACKSNDKKPDAAVNTAPLTQDEKDKVSNDTANFTTLQWLDSTTIDLGKLKKDQSLELTFRFKNSGNKNLIIENVSAQCGCTIPEKPEKPFAPGEEGVIKAKYNGSGHGIITKQIYVVANTNPVKDHTLTFRGEIIE
ncbi:MAG: DUF1573 domain-containing protein [Chitinophagaceae bacterium]